MRVSSRLNTLFAVILIVVLSLWSVWRVAERPKDVVVDPIDGALIVWILNQTISKIPDDLENIFEANIFYPYKNTLAYSELFVPSSLISLVPTKLTGEPVVAVNTAIIFGQITVVLVVYLWFVEITKSKSAAFLGAVALGLSGIRMHYYAHLQMWNMQWWLISVWMLWRYFKNKKAWQIYVSAAFVVLQAWESLLPVYFILLASVLLVTQHGKVFLNNLKHFLLAGFISSTIIFPVLWTYLGVSREFDYVRSIRDSAHFALSFEQLGGQFFSSGLFFLFGLSLILSPFALKKNRKNLKWFWLLLFVSFVLALGPVLKWQGATVKIFNNIFIPLPYGILHYIVPGFKALRTPSRWLFVSSFAASGIIAITFSNFKHKRKNLVVLFAIMIAIIGGSRIPRVYEFPRVSGYPNVYRWLKTQSDKVIIELPIYSWGAGEKVAVETSRMVYSTYHKKKLVNGYSGFTPPEWMKLVANLSRDFPGDDLEVKLKTRGVTLIIVTKEEYPKLKLKQINEWGKGKKVWEDEKHVVYEI